jgi:DNA-binding transcriptional MerR regulator
MQPERHFSIGELAELAGISRRSVRYYVQRSLIPPPLGAGRGHYYTEEHLQRLLSIKLLQERGLSLEEIERHLGGGGSGAARGGERVSRSAACHSVQSPTSEHVHETPIPDLSRWIRVGVTDGVELHIEGSRCRLSPGKLVRLRQAVRAIIGGPFQSDDNTEEGGGNHGKG